MNSIPRRQEQRPTPSLFRAYQGLFDFFNGELFGARLPQVVLNFSRHAGAVGFFAADRWERGTERAHEISLNPSHLKSQTPVEVCQTLVHEMVHLQQLIEGQPSRPGYHNHQFADMMQAIGLIPSSTGRPGGARVGQKMADYPEKGGRFERAFDKLLRRRDDEQLFPWLCVDEPRKQKQAAAKNKVKYSCERCGVNVWGKPELNLVCGDCDEPFVIAE